MTLDEVRKNIDTIDPQICDLIMKRMDCSYKVAEAKLESGDTNIYRADREVAILERLGKEVPKERKAAYLAIVRKIMETSRMYQYGLLFDWMGNCADDLLKDVEIKESDTHVCISLSRENRPNAMSTILSMVGDYGYDLCRIEQLMADEQCVRFSLDMLGNLGEENMQKLMFQLSMESKDFKIEKTY